MNKIVFFFCNLLAFLGVCILFLTNFFNQIAPTLGKVAFQAAASGGYSPEEYVVNFTIINLLATLLIIGGVGSSYYLYKNENQQPSD